MKTTPRRPHDDEKTRGGATMSGRASAVLSLLVLMSMTSCGETAEETGGPAATPTSVTNSEAVTSPSPTEVVPLADGPLEPGRYRFVVSVDCEGVTDDPIACPEGVADPPPIPLEVTVPDGWEHLPGFPVIRTLGEQTHEEGALVDRRRLLPWYVSEDDRSAQTDGGVHPLHVELA